MIDAAAMVKQRASPRTIAFAGTGPGSQIGPSTSRYSGAGANRETASAIASMVARKTLMRSMAACDTMPTP